jgi:hypothetical protein
MYKYVIKFIDYVKQIIINIIFTLYVKILLNLFIGYVKQININII